MRCSVYLFFILLLVCQSNRTWGQIEIKYSYDDFGEKEEWRSVFKKASQSQIMTIEGRHKNAQRQFYKKQEKSFVRLLNDSRFVFNYFLETEVQRVFDHILEVNAELQDQQTIFCFDRSMYPNALAYGNGFFTINLGLFDLLESEDELAFILCHEMAHQYLNHIPKSIRRRVERLNSKEIKRKYKNYRKRTFGQSSARLSLIQELSFDFSSHSRVTEMEADQLGAQFFMKTKYSTQAMESALRKLAELEELTFSQTIDWEKILNVEGFQFNQSLLEEEESLFSADVVLDDYKMNEDSLRSHPHANDRINKIKELFEEPEEGGIASDSGHFSALKEIAYRLAIITSIEKRNLDFAFYLTASRLSQEGNAPEFYRNQMGWIFIEISRLKKAHELSRYIAQPNNLYDEVHLDDVRKLIHRLSIKDLDSLIDGYSQLF